MNNRGRSLRGHLFDVLVIDIEKMPRLKDIKKMDVPSGYLFIRFKAFRNEMILAEKLRGVPLGNVPNNQ